MRHSQVLSSTSLVRKTVQVRSPFRAGQYPVDMRGVYASTPDEGIAEFYTQESVFCACDGHMPDLQLPEWAPDVATFLRLHRCGLTIYIQCLGALFVWIYEM